MDKGKMISLVLIVSILNTTFCGCAGRVADPVRIQQFGDDQKSCEALRVEMLQINNEISRLLPQSDKTGSNIALGATGMLFIVPLFFMDLKQGEKKEIQAYQQRYNHLFMLVQLKDCKITQDGGSETN